MPRWIVLFDDEPAMNDVRRQLSDAHLAYLAAHREQIPIGGGLRTEPGGPFVGGLWILDLDERDDIVRLVENDPYFRSGHRKYRILSWGKASEDMTITL